LPRWRDAERGGAAKGTKTMPKNLAGEAYLLARDPRADAEPEPTHAAPAAPAEPAPADDASARGFRAPVFYTLPR
jgi:hypothetical protein